MSRSDGKVNKSRPNEGLKTSSPAKVYQSRASKPSGVDALGLDASATYVEAEIQSLADKLDELIAALKK